MSAHELVAQAVSTVANMSKEELQMAITALPIINQPGFKSKKLYEILGGVKKTTEIFTVIETFGPGALAHELATRS